VTLVARIMLGGAPFLIGDALISSDDLSNPHVTGVECELPLVGEINSLLAANERPFRADLCQKLHVFEGRLAVAWSANDARQAGRALKVLREVAKKPDVTLADVQEELLAIDPDQIKDLSLVGSLLRAVNGNQISCTVFGSNAIAENVTGFGEVQTAGSGARTFIEMLQRNEPLPSTANGPWTVLAVLGTLLNYELSTGQSIDERWGGAFETVSFSRHTGRLEKLDNVLHTFWLWRDDGKIDFQPRFYFARYFDELLMLRSAEYEAGENHSIRRLKSNKLRLVPSLLRPVRDDDLVKIGHVDFSYDYVCCHVWFRGAPGRATPRAAIVLTGPRGSLYDIDLSVAGDGSLRLRLPSDTVTNVFEAAKQTAARLRELHSTRR
jgi:hypothetical protein